MARGALPDHEISDMMANGIILHANARAIQASSLDVSLSDEIYRVDGAFLPRRGESVKNSLCRRSSYRIKICQPLERGITYIARMNEALELPRGIYGYANPKSSTGRHFISTQLIGDAVEAYDSFPSGYMGDIWGFITPDSYPIVIEEGESLNQVRFFDSDSRLDATEIAIEFKNSPIMYLNRMPVDAFDLNLPLERGRLVFTLDLGAGIVGYRALKGNIPLIYSERGVDFHNFFEQIRFPQNGEICIKAGEFALLRTREWISVSPGIAAEVEALDSRSGDFVSHKAGFIDPGYGWNNGGACIGLPITLEIHAVHRNIILNHTQRICRVSVERMRSNPDKPYAGNYHASPRFLPKQFLEPA